MLRPIHDVVTDMVVRRRLKEAFDIQRRLPCHAWPQGFRLVHGTGLLDGQPERRLRDEALPTAREISEADEALGWLVHLHHADEMVRRAVHLKAMGLSLRQIGPKLSVSHVWAGRLEARGVAMIVAALRSFNLLPGLSTMGQRAA